MAPQNAVKCPFRREQNGPRIQQVTHALGNFAQYFTNKVPTLLALKSRGPHYEKLMSFQADDLRLYSEAYARWADPNYLTAARSLYRYMTMFLAAPDDGFYVCQDANLTDSVTGHEFYPKDDAGRRALGVLRVDVHEYTRETAWAIRALCKYFDVTGDAQALDRAEKAARWAKANRARLDGGYRHDAQDRGGPFLDDSLAITQALLSLYQSTADRSWLLDAEGSLNFIDRRLRHSTMGFISAPQAANAAGVFREASRTAEQNADLVLAANMAYRFTGEQKYRSMSRHAMRFLTAFGKTESERFHPEILLADQESSAAPIHITIVGAHNDPAAQRLHAAALRYPGSYLQVEWWDTAERSLPNSAVHYPQLDRAAAFACSATACSMPIFEASQIIPAVLRSLDN